MARSTSPVPHALHPDLLVLDQPGRALLRLRHRRPAATLRPPQRPSTRTRHPQLGQRMEREPEALHLDQTRRTNPRIPQTTSTTNYRRRTLGPSGTGLGLMVSISQGSGLLVRLGVLRLYRPGRRLVAPRLLVLLGVIRGLLDDARRVVDGRVHHVQTHVLVSGVDDVVPRTGRHLHAPAVLDVELELRSSSAGPMVTWPFPASSRTNWSV